MKRVSIFSYVVPHPIMDPSSHPSQQDGRQQQGDGGCCRHPLRRRHLHPLSPHLRQVVLAQPSFSHNHRQRRHSSHSLLAPPPVPWRPSHPPPRQSPRIFPIRGPHTRRRGSSPHLRIFWGRGKEAGMRGVFGGFRRGREGTDVTQVRPRFPLGVH